MLTKNNEGVVPKEEGETLFDKKTTDYIHLID